MARRTPAAAIAAVFGAILIAPAAAQFGSIFGDSPPRPPSGVPGGGQQPVPPPSYPSNVPGSYPAPPAYPAPAPGGSSAAVESRPLPPPGGGAAVDPVSRGPALRPRAIPSPADTSPQPGDEVVTEPPSQKIENTSALFSGLDKITGRIINFDAAIGETVQFGALQLTPRACYTRPPTETANTDAFIDVDEVTLQGEVRRIFTGWMFAASPGLHAIEHPIYDIWLTDCKGAAVTAEKQAEPPAPTPAAARTQPKQQPKQQPQRQTPARQQQQGFPPLR
jgi:hypothetical protein